MEWSQPHPILFALVTGLGLLGILMMARRFARSPDARSLILLLLRAGALTILVLILLDPIQRVETRIPGEKPSAIYLIDGSRSMGLERPSSRLDLVNRRIEAAEASIGAVGLPRIDRYRFGDQIAAVETGETVRASDDHSRLLGALERLPARFGESLPLGVFVFSDGRATETSGFESMARGFKKLGVPIHVYPVGDRSISGDVSIRDLIFPRKASPGSQVPIKVMVQSRGFDGHRAEVIVRPAEGADLRPLAVLPITLEGGDQSAELVIELNRARGPMLAEVIPIAGESVIENNRAPFQVAARSSKLRVIYMEGSPDPEYAFIRDALMEDPEIECLAMSTDQQNNFQPRLHRVGNPSQGYPTTRDELMTYDVIICSDISRAAFTPAQLEWTVELVAKRGGGFAMIGGHTSFGSGGWDRTAWDGMIPIDMSGNGAGRASPYFDGTFRVLVPPGAESHPIWRIVEDPVKNSEILKRMPPFYGTNLTDRLKPAATLLGFTDRPISGVSSGNDPVEPAPTRSGSPIFSAQPYGKGRSFAMSTDSTVAWGADFERKWGEGDNRYFRKFWRNVVRWLAENSGGSDRRIEIATDKAIYRPGQPIVLTAQAFDDLSEPTDKYRLVGRLLGPGPTELLPPLVGDTPLESRVGANEFAGSLTVPSTDRIRSLGSAASALPLTVEVIAFEGDRVVGWTSIDVQVLDDSEEYRDPRPNPARLEILARNSGGEILRGSEDLARLLERSTDAADRVASSQAPAWDLPVVMGLVFVLISAEWVIRRSKGLA